MARARLFCKGNEKDYYYFGDRLIIQQHESGTVGYGPHKFPPRISVTGHLTAAQKRRLKKRCREGKL